MKITKRALIRAFCFALAAVLALGAKDLMLMSENNDLKLGSKYNYNRALDDLSDELDNVSVTLEKQLYAQEADIHRDLSVKLCAEATGAKAALAQLPAKNTELTATNKFLSQVGDYSLSLSRKLSNGEELTEEEYENISKLYDFSKELCEKIRTLRESVMSGEAVFEDVSDSDVSSVADGFDDADEIFEGYPSLIYDGPFSDNILEKEPQMTPNVQTVTKEDALTKCRMALGISANDLSVSEDVKGKMPCWRFSDKDGGVCCEITKNGGFLSYFLRSRQPEKQKLTEAEALEHAKSFLEGLGMDSLMTTYYETYANVMTVNFAYKDVKVCCYTDLIKVSVALDNGEILGYDAKGYLVNHRKRYYSEDIISQSAAKKRVSPKLTVTGWQLCLIPADDLSERYCYEFKCRAENGRSVLVYINAETGKEEQILLLIKSNTGVLTI